MNSNLSKISNSLISRKKDSFSSRFQEKIKNRKNKSQDKKISPNKNKYSINILFRKRINNSIENFNGPLIKRKNNSIERFNDTKNKKNKIYHQQNNSTKNYLYNHLISSFPFYNLNLDNIIYNLNNIIYFSEDSTIYRGKYFHNDVCIKEIKNINNLSEDSLNKIINEIDISIKLHHKNIVNTLGYSFNLKKTKIFIITEYMKNKNLKIFIDSNKGNIALKKKLQFIFEISLAIEYMHSNNNKILHRDIKSSNILLDDDLHCKLCDFGMSKFYNNNNKNLSYQESNNNLNTNYQTNSQSTLFWMSPEYLCDGITNEKSDIYSFGILIWEIFMEDTNPYKNININDYLLGNKKIVYNNRPIIKDSYFKDCPEIKELMISMWNQDYNKRPDIENILNKLEELNGKYSFL